MKTKRKKRVSPTQMTLKYLRARGLACEIVERWVKFGAKGGCRRDIFGGDIQALTTTEILSIQCGISAHHSEKIRKAIADPKVKLWLASPSRVFQIWTWSERVHFNATGAKSKRMRWMPRVSQIGLTSDGKLEAVPFELKGR